MNITQLIEELENIKITHGKEVEVRLAVGPHYPYENEIAGVSEPLVPALFEEDEGPAESRDSNTNLEVPVVYLCEGEQIGYLPGRAQEELEYVW